MHKDHAFHLVAIGIALILFLVEYIMKTLPLWLMVFIFTLGGLLLIVGILGLFGVWEKINKRTKTKRFLNINTVVIIVLLAIVLSYGGYHLIKATEQISITPQEILDNIKKEPLGLQEDARLLYIGDPITWDVTLYDASNNQDGTTMVTVYPTEYTSPLMHISFLVDNNKSGLWTNILKN